jgi:hypothetical protein
MPRDGFMGRRSVNRANVIEARAEPIRTLLLYNSRFNLLPVNREKYQRHAAGALEDSRGPGTSSRYRLLAAGRIPFYCIRLCIRLLISPKRC